MKSFISILILSLFAVTAFTQAATNCPVISNDDQDACMLIASFNCPWAQTSGCDHVQPYSVPDNQQISCEDACALCLNCVYETGPDCCPYAIWSTQYQPCLNYCYNFY